MKKLMCAILCIVFAATSMVGAQALTASGYDVGTVTSFTLTPEADYLNTVTSSSKEAVSAVKALLASAKTAKTVKNAAPILRLTVVSADKTSEFTLSRSGEDYILSAGNRSRTVAYADVNKMINAIGSDKVYRYRGLPQATVQGSSLGIQQGSYSYRRISGQFSNVKITTSERLPEMRSPDGALPTMELDRDAAVTVQVYSGKTALWEGDAKAAQAYRLPKPGSYEVRVRAKEDSALCKYDITYACKLTYAAGIHIAVDGADTHLGEVVVLRVTGTGPNDALATFTSDMSLNLPPRFHREADGSQVALFPVSYRNAAGAHWIEIKAGGETARFTISAKDKNWQRQDLTVSDSTAQETVNSQKANEEYERVIAPLRSVADEKRWSGRFILPVSDEKVTTEFGMVRYVNGAPTSTRHGALDLAVPRGTQVKATGAGRVLYAGFLQLTGNTVLIEHGCGLKSWYYHMDSLNVKSDELVKQGQVVGTVGSTGFSTGPHLHFGMSVNNVFINPYTAINTDLLA